jgi:proteasome beta subunit
MYEDHIRAAVEHAIPARQLRRLQHRAGIGSKRAKPLTSRIRSSTTIATMLYRDGVLCVADRKTSGWGYSILSQRSIKITPVSSHSALLGSGSVSDIQMAYQTLQNVNSEFEEDNTGESLSVAGQAHVLAQLFRLWGQYYGLGISVGILLAGFDEVNGPSMFSIDDDGCSLRRTEFATAGSGGDRIEDQFDARWEPNLPFEKALDVAMHGMIHSGMRDSGSSPPIIALPTVVVVRNDGVHTIEERVIEKALGHALLTKRHVRKSFARALIGGKE